MLASNHYIQEIKQILSQARQKAYQAVNSAMVEAYWKIGERIVQEEQNGQSRAEYGKEIIKNLSAELTAEFGKGFTERNLRNFRQFYIEFTDLNIWKSVISKLTWTHFQRVLKVTNPQARHYYLTESAENGWSVRTLDRNISTLYYDRLLASQDKGLVEQEMKEKTATLQAADFIKSPTVLEFLNLPTSMTYSEAELEKALIDNLQQFMLELGKGFAFVARQQHIRTELSDFFVDLVFYNYILKCFVIVELKTDKLTHQDIGSWICMCECMTIYTASQAITQPSVCCSALKMTAWWRNTLCCTKIRNCLPVNMCIIYQARRNWWRKSNSRNIFLNSNTPAIKR